jgi:hypothetical protein
MGVQLLGAPRQSLSGHQYEENPMRFIATAIVTLTCISTPSFAGSTDRTSTEPMPTVDLVAVDLVAVDASISIDLDRTSREGMSFDSDIWIDHVRSDGHTESFVTEGTCDIRLDERTVDCADFALATFTVSTRDLRTVTVDLQPGSILAYKAGSLVTLLNILTDDDDAEEAGSSGNLTDQACSPPGTSSGPHAEVGCASAGGGTNKCCNLVCTYSCQSVHPVGATWGGRECGVPSDSDCWFEAAPGGGSGGGPAEVIGDGSF